MTALILAFVLCSDPVEFQLQRGGDPAATSDVDTPADGPTAPQVDFKLSPMQVGEIPDTESGDSSPAPVQNTAVCQCRGYNESVCFCLKTGQKCHCSRDSGSVWNVTDSGRPINKTGRKANPNMPLNVVADAVKTDGYAVESNGSMAYWTDSAGLRWNNQGSGLVEGQTFYHNGSARFVYRNGTMHEAGSAPLVNTDPQPAQQSGHWAWQKVCHGNYCTMERRWIND